MLQVVTYVVVHTHTRGAGRVVATLRARTTWGARRQLAGWRQQHTATLGAGTLTLAAVAHSERVAGGTAQAQAASPVHMRVSLERCVEALRNMPNGASSCTTFGDSVVVAYRTDFGRYAVTVNGARVSDDYLHLLGAGAALQRALNAA